MEVATDERWQCQRCRSPLVFHNEPSNAQASLQSEGFAARGGVPVMVASRVATLDPSYVVLPDTHGRKEEAIDPWAAIPPLGYIQNAAALSGPSATGLSMGSHSGHCLEALESRARNNCSLYRRLSALDRIFQLVSTHMEVPLPLCLDCAGQCCRVVEEQCKEAEADIEVYESALRMLRFDEAFGSLSADFDPIDPIGHDIKGAHDERYAQEQGEGEEDEEEQQLKSELNALKGERMKADEQLKNLLQLKRQLDIDYDRLGRYWEEVNELMFKVADDQSTREAVAAQIEVYNAQLESLQDVAVLNDAFPIWDDQEFGTIGSFRLGRLSTAAVEWSEINAAWGQACHLLHTLSKICGCQLSCQVVPMGSYPRIIQGENQYELFGPVNSLWSVRYDQAMVLFLRCLKELAELASNKVEASPLPANKCFQLPYKIQDDKINDYTIKQSFNRDSAWTKALKYTVGNLKWLQFCVINRNQSDTSQALPPTRLSS